MLTWRGTGGFSLDASVRVEGTDRAGPERLVRYLARPPFALERLHPHGSEPLSSSAPFVAGVVALYRQQYSSDSPSTVGIVLNGSATQKYIPNGNGSPNRILYFASAENERRDRWSDDRWSR